jgi:hypothetical protein
MTDDPETAVDLMLESFRNFAESEQRHDDLVPGDIR